MESNLAEAALQSSLDRCRVAGLRKTKALEGVLRLLFEKGKPLSLAQVASALSDQCDRATVYRLLMRLEEHGILRRLGFLDRSTYFTVRHEDHHDDYLICTECGTIDKLSLGCPAEALEREISEKSGFRRVYHELEFYGICPDCHTVADS